MKFEGSRTLTKITRVLLKNYEYHPDIMADFRTLPESFQKFLKVIPRLPKINRRYSMFVRFDNTSRNFGIDLEGTLYV